MPELPDVEYFKRVLSRSGLQKKIARVSVKDPRILGNGSMQAFVEHVQGCSVVEVRRHGKHLMARLDRDGWLTLHFGMTGALDFVQSPDEEPPFTRMRFDFVNDGCLTYTNKRMIGRVGVVDDVADFVAQEQLGPDALDPHFDLAAFKAAVAGIKRDVKAVLMDQAIVAGIGNIYSDEILFQARIDPRTPMDELSLARLKRLFEAMRKVLEAAIAHGAGSVEFIEQTPKGSLLPERRKGGRCPRCHADLSVSKIGGRTSYFCRHCQR